MTILHHQIITALRAAGADGLSEGEVACVGGRWWRTRLEEVNRWKLATIGEQAGRFYLVAERGVESDRGSNDAAGTDIPSDPSDWARASTIALSPAQQSLFAGESGSHYREAA